MALIFKEKKRKRKEKKSQQNLDFSRHETIAAKTVQKKKKNYFLYFYWKDEFHVQVARRIVCAGDLAQVVVSV